MNWIKVSDRLPPVSNEDTLSCHEGESEKIIVLSKEYGVRLGRYGGPAMYPYDGWNIDHGVLPVADATVTHWMAIELPKD